MSNGQQKMAALGLARTLGRMNASVLYFKSLTDVDTLMTMQTLRNCLEPDRLSYVLFCIYLA